MNRYCALLVVFFLACAPGTHAALVEEVVQLAVEATDMHGKTHRHTITLTIFRDDARGNAKSPFLILNHGRAGEPAGRARLGRARFSDNSAYFVALGFAVFVPTRMGYGVSGGADVEFTGPCNARDYPAGFEAAAAQSVAVIDYAKSQSYVDAAKGIVAGQSFGGATAVALAAKNISGIHAAINFAGGAGGNPTGRPENPCQPERIAQTYAEYGKTAKTPTLWLYSENDQYWGKALPQLWVERYRELGGMAEFVQLPPSGRDGHSSFTANPEVWKPHVEKFLSSVGF